MSRLLTLLFAIAGGIAVGNLYWAQPLLAVMAKDFGVSQDVAGILVTVTQVGYAAGVLFVVPLGDNLNRRILVPVMVGLSALSLLAAATAPSYGVMLFVLFCVGATTVGGQLLAPLAGDLARPEERGRVLGTISSGMLSGILLSRTLSGMLSDHLGWRAIFALAAMASLCMAVLLFLKLPKMAARGKQSYRTMFASMYALFRAHAAVSITLLTGALVFSVFTLFWTGLTFLLTAAPYHYSLTQIGAMGIAGLAGALMAKKAGKLHDAGLSSRATGLALFTLLASLLLAEFAPASILVIAVTVVLLDAAIQCINVLNQTRLLSLKPEARSRLNSMFVTTNFLAGAVGSALAGLLWPYGGWTTLMLFASILTVAALLIWWLKKPVFDV